MVGVMQRGNSSSKICFSWRFPLCYYYCFASEIRFVRVPLFFPFARSFPLRTGIDQRTRLYRSASLLSTYRVWLGITGLLLGCYWVVTGLLLGCYWVVVGFTGFYWGILGFTCFLWVFYWVLLGFTCFLWVFYWVLLGFTGFYWVLPSFT